MSQKEEAFEKLPSSIRKSFMILWEETIELYASWEVYTTLFATEETLAILNSTASATFRVIERSFRVSLAVSIGRLTESAETGKNLNLSLEHLIREVRSIGEEKLADSLVRLHKEIIELSKPLTVHRNKAFAHKDLNTALRRSENPLPGINSTKITNIVEKIASFMNLIQDHFDSSHTSYDHVIEHGKASDFVRKLKYWQLVSDKG